MYCSQCQKWKRHLPGYSHVLTTTPCVVLRRDLILDHVHSISHSAAAAAEQEAVQTRLRGTGKVACRLAPWNFPSNLHCISINTVTWIELLTKELMVLSFAEEYGKFYNSMKFLGNLSHAHAVGTTLSFLSPHLTRAW